MSEFLTIDRVLSLPHPDNAPDPIHRLIYYLEAAQVFLHGCAYSFDKRTWETNNHLRIQFWTPFWAKYSTENERLSSLRGDAKRWLVKRGQDPKPGEEVFEWSAANIYYLSTSEASPTSLPRVDSAEEITHRMIGLAGSADQAHQATLEKLLHADGLIGKLICLLEDYGVEHIAWQEWHCRLNKRDKVKDLKTSHGPGESRLKLISALSSHHMLAEGCTNFEPIGNNALARLAEVNKGVTSLFFNRVFNGSAKGGHTRYKFICLKQREKLRQILKTLNDEYARHVLFARTPPGETREEEE